MWTGVRCELDRVQLRRQALTYAWHGWDVMPGAYVTGDRFSCGPGCHTVACHPATMDGTGSASHEPDVIEDWWSIRPYSVLLTTGLAFDVLEIPGSADADRMAPTGPAAMTPAGRLMLLVRPGGALRPELAARHDTVLHAARSWIPAPSTRTPDGPVRWLVPPVTVGWRLPDPLVTQERVMALLSGRRSRD